MNRREMIIRTGAAALGLGLSRSPFGWAARSNHKRRVLFFTKSSGHEHSSIKRQDGQLSHAERILTDLGAQHGFEVTATKDGRVFTPEHLAKYDVYAFYTTGDLTQPGTDQNPPMRAEGKAAFLAAIKNGKGFVGFHSATDTFHTPGDRYQNYGEQSDPYIKMIGGEFIRHGAQQKAKMIATDTKFPGFGELRDGFELLEEWYSFKDYAKDLHVLLVQDTKGMQGNVYQRAPYPATWARRHGQGRVFYTSMGHREDVWTNTIFQTIILGGLSWAAGNVKADVKPNIEIVTPKYDEIPPKG